jgi:hypothetical protein
MMSALTHALEQLDRAIAAVDTALATRLDVLEKQKKTLQEAYEAEREKNRIVSSDLSATIAQLETYLQRTGTGQ